MMNKIISASEAINVIQDNNVLASSGFRWSGSPELLLSELGLHFEKNKSPKDLILTKYSSKVLHSSNSDSCSSISFRSFVSRRQRSGKGL